MICKAILGSASNPEYGSVTVSFPLPDSEYDHTIERLEDLGIGDVLKQDCRIMEFESQYPVLKRMEGTEVNVDELDYLARRLDSFDDGEAEQFLATAHMLNLKDIKDFINLTFCCQEATVISDFSNLEQAGRDHALHLNGGAMSNEEWDALDGCETALRLIETGAGTVTPYGVVYDNGMKLEPLYDGRHFPTYLYSSPVLALEAVSGEIAVSFCLPIPDRQLHRALARAGLENQNIPLGDVMNELPEKVKGLLDGYHLVVEDLPSLNRLCRAIEPLKNTAAEKLNAVVLMAEPQTVCEIYQLAENLEQFDFVPGVHTPEEYGRYMIRESGKFEYDENLSGFYNYSQYGEQRVREEAGQFSEYGYVVYHGTMTLDELMRDESAEHGPQMGGMIW